MRALPTLLLLAGCSESSSADPDAGADADADMDADADGSCEDCETSESGTIEGCDETVGTSFACEGACHEDVGTDIVWKNNPPHSGSHFGPPNWEHDAGEHTEAVERGAWVHNLEHGWVVLLHDCPAECEAELDVLRAVMDARPDAPILMTPDPLLDGPRFAAVAWTWVLETDAPVLEELLCFVDQHLCHTEESELLYPTCTL
jgi:hypothetical protein